MMTKVASTFRISRAALLPLALLALGCNGVHYDKPLAHGSPLLRSDWQPLIPRRTSTIEYEPTGATPDDRAEDQPRVAADARAAMVAAARELLADGERPEYGLADVERALTAAIPGFRWRASEGLVRLIDVARRAQAFETDGDPRPGDVVLFHNLFDANGNGKVDDWNTGCGIVTADQGRRFEAVVRTGHAPRRVLVWPDGPARRTLDGRPANSFLRVPHPSDPPDTPYLAGQLYAGHLDVDRLATTGDAE